MRKAPIAAFLATFLALAAAPAPAGEGMWVPQQLPEIAGPLREAGLRLAPEQLADLTGDNADDVIGGLTSDLSGGALSIVMSIASTVPEIGALMGQLMSNANTPAA